MSRIMIDNDNWDDHGIIFNLSAMKSRSGSTAVQIYVEYAGKSEWRTVANNQIVWLE